MKANPAPESPAARANRRRRRRVVRTAAGAVIGGLIAGPVGLAAGAIAARGVKRGPQKKNAVPAKTSVAKPSKPIATKRVKRKPRVKVPPITPLPL